MTARDAAPMRVFSWFMVVWFLNARPRRRSWSFPSEFEQLKRKRPRASTVMRENGDFIKDRTIYVIFILRIPGSGCGGAVLSLLDW